MKAKYALVVLLVAALALIGTGCKATGGGWFNDVDDGKVIFGFNAQSTSGDTDAPSPPPDWERMAAKGQFQMVVHGTKDNPAKTRMHGTFTGTWVPIQPESNGVSYFCGTGSRNGGDPEPFFIQCQDLGEPGFSKGDQIMIVIGTNDPATWASSPGSYLTYDGVLGGGNIQVHEK